MSFGSLYESHQQALRNQPRVQVVTGPPASRDSSPLPRCPHAVWIGACPACHPIHTSKDRTWHFTHPTLGQIDSKGAFDRRCKENGLVRVSEDELTTRGNPTKPAMPRLSERVIGDIYSDVKQQSRNPDLVEQKWRETQANVATPISPVGVEYAKPEGSWQGSKSHSDQSDRN